MTQTGIEDLKKRIGERKVFPPENTTIEQLHYWLTGYAQCYKDVMDILEDASRMMKAEKCWEQAGKAETPNIGVRIVALKTGSVHHAMPKKTEE